MVPQKSFKKITVDFLQYGELMRQKYRPKHDSRLILLVLMQIYHKYFTKIALLLVTLLRNFDSLLPY